MHAHTHIHACILSVYYTHACMQKTVPPLTVDNYHQQPTPRSVPDSPPVEPNHSMTPDLWTARDLSVESVSSQQSETVPNKRYHPRLKQPRVRSASNSNMSEQAASPTYSRSKALRLPSTNECGEATVRPTPKPRRNIRKPEIAFFDPNDMKLPIALQENIDRGISKGAEVATMVNKEEREGDPLDSPQPRLLNVHEAVP